MKKSKSFFAVFTVLLITSCLGTPELYDDKELRSLAPIASTTLITDDLEAQREIMMAFAKGYPGKINSVEFIDNDWTMLVKGMRFFYANGRFLPEALREQWEDYAPYDFYAYPWLGTEKQRQAVYRFPVYSTGSSFLFDALYASPAEDDSWDLQVKYSFLGVKMLVHSDIEALLDNVSQQILDTAKTDPSINQWIGELQTSPPSFGWNWREIVNTNRRSNHSYGTAVDLLPADLAGRRTYWQWHQNKKAESDVTYYFPPAAVIQAFEDNGFIWGGNWDLIDTMHFEYRPEILILNGLR